MKAALERVLSIVVSVSAVAVAFAVVHREFFNRGGARQAEGRPPEFVARWEDALTVARHIGPQSARIQIVEFADLECPACKHFHKILKQAMREYPNDVAVAFVHLPLSYHRFARPAARASECAFSQGRFAEFVDVAYALQDSLGLKPWSSLALRAAVPDTALFARCTADTSKVQSIDGGVELASRMGIHGTPTLILHGWRYSRLPTESELIEAIGRLLEKS